MMNKRNIGTIVCLVAASMIGVSSMHGVGNEAGKPAAVMQEMRDTARQLVREREQAYREGVGSIDSVIAAQQKLREVELRLASDPEQRMSILAATLKAARELEELTKARVERGLAANADHLEARLARLAAELSLLEAGG